jgi:uncharacterized protein (TIGR03437 family)
MYCNATSGTWTGQRTSAPYPTIFAITPGGWNGNGYDNLIGSVAPGEIITLWGSAFGPATADSQAPSNGSYPFIANGISVIFGSPGNYVHAPILYRSDRQINIVVPYGIGSMPFCDNSPQTICTTEILVWDQTGPFPDLVPGVAISAAAPYFFTTNSAGQVAAVNQDGTINSVQHPIPRGQIISLYATGEGQTTPMGVDGELDGAPLPRPILPVTITVGGLPAQVLYAGGAPGEVAGLMQVNVSIPMGLKLPPGTASAVPVVLTVGKVSSSILTTIAVSP